MVSLSIARGRDLCWSPQWTCSHERILFDANSGDYWVLSRHAAQVVAAVMSEDGLSYRHARRRWAGAEDAAEPTPPAESKAMFRTLIQAGLVCLRPQPRGGGSGARGHV